MKNKSYFVINYTIFIIGLFSIFHNNQFSSSFDYYPGEVKISNYLCIKNHSNSNSFKAVVTKDALFQNNEISIKKASKITNICKEDAGSSHTSFVLKQTSCILLKHTTVGDLFITFQNLRI